MSREPERISVFSAVEQEELRKFVEERLAVRDGNWRAGFVWILDHLRWLEENDLQRPPGEGLGTKIRRDTLPTHK